VIIVRTGIHVSEHELEALCRRFEVRELDIFGSSARGDFDEDSDIDLLVEFQPSARIGLIRLGRLQRELAELLGRQVDLVPKGGLKPIIREQVLSEARLLYAA